MSAQTRLMLIETAYNLRFDMDCIGEEIWEELYTMSDEDVIRFLNEIIEDL